MQPFNMIAMFAALAAFMVLRTMVGALGLHPGLGFGAAVASVFVYFAVDDYQQKKKDEEAKQRIEREVVAKRKSRSRKKKS